MNNRQQHIINILKQKKVIKIEELSHLLAYSSSTIRRDIIFLEEIGLVKRSKGHVQLSISTNKEKHFRLRNLENSAEKTYMANLCTDFFTDGMSIFLDGSSSALKICPILSQYKDITVVTNGIEIAYTLMHCPNIEVFLNGGYIREGTSSVVGEPGIEFLKQFNLDLAIVSCSGIDSKAIYDASLQQAYVKRCMLEHAKLRVLLCDSSKFKQIYKFKLCDFHQINYLITNTLPPNTISHSLQSCHCEVIY